MRKTILLFPAIVLMTAFAPAPPDRTQQDLKKLQGTWVMVDYFQKGGPKLRVRHGITGESLYTMTITGKRITRTRGGEKDPCEWEITLNARKKPKQLDCKVVKGKSNPESTLGIYRFEDDKLIMCYHPSERPVDFEGTTRGAPVETFERIKP